MLHNTSLTLWWNICIVSWGFSFNLKERPGYHGYVFYFPAEMPSSFRHSPSLFSEQTSWTSCIVCCQLGATLNTAFSRRLLWQPPEGVQFAAVCEISTIANSGSANYWGLSGHCCLHGPVSGRWRGGNVAVSTVASRVATRRVGDHSSSRVEDV